MSEPAVLGLEDGTIFHGRSIGAAGETTGEVVFNTAMSGYQEILTDPSYARQIVTLTYPHIGNVGANPEDMESDRVHAAGLIIRDLPAVASSWRATEPLPEFLRRQGVVAISDLDTRRLTRIIREKGAQGGCIIAGSASGENAVEKARQFPGLKGMDLARVVTTESAYDWEGGAWRHPQAARMENPTLAFRVVAYDFGVKRNILRLLTDAGCRVTVVPATTPAEQVLAMEPDGVFLSNGPGDPEPCDYAIEATRAFMDMKVPVFGICLGHQILGQAFGGQTYRLKFGHHGGNQPVKHLPTGRVEISAHNHNFAVDPSTLPAEVEITHLNLNDGCCEGMRHTSLNALSIQYHPEAAPGPHDPDPLFAEFIGMMLDASGRQAGS
ncbi:MAG: glutamine-hydrolyzing carbamoyl-phosphate synthase small subunit [Chloroflexota bacterium]